MEKVLSNVFVFLFSTLKFLAGYFAATAAHLGLEGSIVNVIGAIIGVVLFTYLGSIIQEYFVRTYPNRFGKKFTRSNRLLVRVKQKFGLGGIAALTPIILSIPVGVLFALALTTDKRKIMITMITSLLFWATLLFLPYFLFKINVFDVISKIFE